MSLWAYDEPTPTATNGFSVLSWNILANAYCFENFYKHLKKDYSVLSWKRRRPQIIEHLLRSNCDVVCLQEVDSVSDVVGPLQEAGYDYRALRRSGHKQDHCVVAWKRASFCCCDSVEVYFDQLMINGEHRVALICTLIPNANEAQLAVVSSTHLDYKNSRVTERQAALLRDLVLNKAATMSKLHRRHPAIVIAGDFNSAISSLAGKYLLGSEVCPPSNPGLNKLHQTKNNNKKQNTAGRKNSKKKGNKAAGQNVGPLLHSVYPERREEGGHFYSAATPNGASLIDHIVYYPRASNVVSFRDLPPIFAPLPTDEWPSDHLSVCCLFQFLKK